MNKKFIIASLLIVIIISFSFTFTHIKPLHFSFKNYTQSLISGASAGDENPPVLTSVSPLIIYSAAGVQVTLYGTNLDTVTSFRSNGILYSLQLFQPFTVTSTSVTFTLPVAIPENTYQIGVINDRQQESNTIPQYVLYYEGDNNPPSYQINTGGPSRQRSRNVWFVPNFGSSDLTTMFSRENDWKFTKANVDVFGLFQSNAMYLNSPCPECGDNTYRSLLDKDAFTKLRNWNIDLAIEVSAIKPTPRCRADMTVPPVLRSIETIYRGGGGVAFISMDEPLIGGTGDANLSVGSPERGCGMTLEETARETAMFINTIKSIHPRIKIGDIEPYPLFNAEEIMNWVNELERQGARLDFFHLDADRNQLLARNIDPVSAMSQLKQYFGSKGISYGIIYNQHPTQPTDQAFFDSVTNWTSFIKQNNIQGTDHIIQSWERDSRGVSSLPANLPETGSYTLTRILLNTLALFNEPNTSFVSQDVPLTMIAGRSYPVTITFRNNGQESWEANRLYKLGSLPQENNSPWGISRVSLSSSEIIQRNGQKTFSFNVTAPSTAGTYRFGWRMLQEGVEWFGDESPFVNVVVSLGEPNLVPNPIPNPLNPINEPPSSSPTIAELEAKILELRAILLALIEKRAGSNVSFQSFNRDLTVGSTGEDVLMLQKILNSKGFSIASTGVGSPGLETNYFGFLTRDALARFQNSKGIVPAVGYFGPITRSALSF